MVMSLWHVVGWQWGIRRIVLGAVDEKIFRAELMESERWGQSQSRRDGGEGSALR